MTDRTERRFDPRHSIDGDLTNRFTYHPPEPEQPEVYQVVRDVAHLLAIVVEAATYPSPERSLAVTKAEEAVMWANAGIARRGLAGGGIAGARDLFDHALETLRTEKPGSTVVEDDGVHWSPVTAWERAAKDAHAALTDRGGVTHEHLRAALTALDKVVLPDKDAEDPWGDEGRTGSTEGPVPHPTDWTAVCPFCPTYIRTEGQGAQRDAQEWVLDHAEQAHGKVLRDA